MGFYLNKKTFKLKIPRNMINKYIFLSLMVYHMTSAQLLQCTTYCPTGEIPTGEIPSPPAPTGSLRRGKSGRKGDKGEPQNCLLCDHLQQEFTEIKQLMTKKLSSIGS